MENKKRYWLRGGIIGLVAGLVVWVFAGVIVYFGFERCWMYKDPGMCGLHTANTLIFWSPVILAGLLLGLFFGIKKDRKSITISSNV